MNFLVGVESTSAGQLLSALFAFERLLLGVRVLVGFSIRWEYECGRTELALEAFFPGVNQLLMPVPVAMAGKASVTEPALDRFFSCVDTLVVISPRIISKCLFAEGAWEL